MAFAGFSLAEPGIYKLHKLYVLPSEQGSGTGRKLILHISDLQEPGAKILELNVTEGILHSNLQKKIGFDIYRTVDISYHNFVLNDYVMRKNL